MSTIDNIKSETKKAKKQVKDKILKLSEYIDDTHEVEIECDEEDLVCMLNNTKSKVKAKMRK